LSDGLRGESISIGRRILAGVAERGRVSAGRGEGVAVSCGLKWCNKADDFEKETLNGMTIGIPSQRLSPKR
jgi:hypothetical protein